MGEPYGVNVDDRKLRERIDGVIARATDATPAFKQIGAMMITSISRNFEVGGRYSQPGSWKGGGKKWQPLALATVLSGKKSARLTKKKRNWKKSFQRSLQNRKILIGKGHLEKSNNFQAHPGGVSIGPDGIDYDLIHQVGGMAGRNQKVEIPARPYLVVQTEDLEESIFILEDFITEE